MISPLETKDIHPLKQKFQKISEKVSKQSENTCQNIYNEEKDAALMLLSINTKPSRKVEKSKGTTRVKPYSKSKQKAYSYGNTKKLTRRAQPCLQLFHEVIDTKLQGFSPP